MDNHYILVVGYLTVVLFRLRKTAPDGAPLIEKPVIFDTLMPNSKEKRENNRHPATTFYQFLIKSKFSLFKFGYLQPRLGTICY